MTPPMPGWVFVAGCLLVFGGALALVGWPLLDRLLDRSPLRTRFATAMRDRIAELVVIGGLTGQDDAPRSLGILDGGPTNGDGIPARFDWSLPEEGAASPEPRVFLPESPELDPGSPLTMAEPHEVEPHVDEEAFRSGFTVEFPAAAAILRETYARVGAR